MKKIAFVLLSVLYPVSLLSQNIEEQAIKVSIPDSYGFHCESAIKEKLHREKDGCSLNGNLDEIKSRESSNGTVYLMDSTYKFIYRSETDSVPEFKHYIVYDSHANKAIQKTYFWRDNTWKQSYKSEHTYDNNDNETLGINYWWNDTIKEWIVLKRDENTFNANNDVIVSIIYLKDHETDQLLGYSKREFTYDANGMQTMTIEYHWDNISDQWIESNKSISSFDVNGNPVLYLSYSWNVSTNQWAESAKGIITYDANQNLTEQVSFTWNNEENQWVGVYKNSYIYDVNNNITQYIICAWDIAENKWIELDKVDYFYNTSGNNTSRIGFKWDKDGNQWHKHSKSEYAYDANNNITLKILYDWNVLSDEWVELERQILGYDSYNNQILLTWYNTDREENEVLMNKDYYYYSLHTNGQLIVNAGNDTAICANESDFNAINIGGNPTAFGGVEPYVYKWTTNNSVASQSFGASFFLDDTTKSNPKLIRPALDFINLKLIVTDNEGTMAEDSITIRFSSFNYLSIDCIYFINQGDTVTLSGNMGMGIGTLSYIWSPNYNISDTTGVSPQAWPDTSVFYHVYAIDSIGCISEPSTCSIYVNSTGISQINDELKKSAVMPNPINNHSVVWLDESIRRNAVLQIFNEKGQFVLYDKFSSDSYLIGDKIIEKGLYVYIITNGNEIVSNGKFVKE